MATKVKAKWLVGMVVAVGLLGVLAGPAVAQYQIEYPSSAPPGSYCRPPVPGPLWDPFNSTMPPCSAGNPMCNLNPPCGTGSAVCPQ